MDEYQNYLKTSNHIKAISRYKTQPKGVVVRPVVVRKPKQTRRVFVKPIIRPRDVKKNTSFYQELVPRTLNQLEEASNKFSQLELDVDSKIAEMEVRIAAIENEEEDELTIEQVVAKIKGEKLLELRDIKGARLDMNDQRWHGGGISKVYHDGTLSGEGTQSSPLSSLARTTNFVDNEIVAGTGTSFTLNHIPVIGSEHLYGGGGRLYPTTDYTMAGDIITTVNSFNAGDILADYRY